MRFKTQIKTSTNTQTEENGAKVGERENIIECGQLDESDIQWWIMNLHWSNQWC